MAVAGAGAGAEIKSEPEINNFGSATLVVLVHYVHNIKVRLGGGLGRKGYHVKKELDESSSFCPTMPVLCNMYNTGTF